MPAGRNLTPRQIERIQRFYREGLETGHIAQLLHLHRYTVSVHRPEDCDPDGLYRDAEMALIRHNRQRMQIRRWQRESAAFDRAFHAVHECRRWQPGVGNCGSRTPWVVPPSDVLVDLEARR